MSITGSSSGFLSRYSGLNISMEKHTPVVKKSYSGCIMSSKKGPVEKKPGYNGENLTQNYTVEIADQVFNKQQVRTVKQLDMKPFPLSVDYGIVHEILENEPDGTWLVHELEGEEYCLVIVEEGEVENYKLTCLDDDVLKDLEPLAYISFDTEILEGSEDHLDSKILMNLLKKKKLYFSERKSIQKQIDFTLKYLGMKSDELRSKAKDRSKSLYLRPKKILKELGESTVDIKIGKDLKAVYKAAHIQVDRDGRIQIIPKHPKLVLGNGFFKKIRLAIDIDNQSLVAFASLNAKNKTERNAIRREVSLIKKCLTKESKSIGDIVKMSVYSRSSQGRKIKIVMPYANRGDVFSENFSNEERPQVLRGMAQYLQFLQSLGIACNDVKPENFLVFQLSQNDIKVRLFDLSIAVTDPEGKCELAEGTGEYYSPEKWAVWGGIKKSFDVFKADLFSLGLSLYQVMNDDGPDVGYYSDKGPWYHLELIRKLNVYNSKSFIIKCLQEYEQDWELFSPKNDLERLVKSMTHPDADKRPNIDLVIKVLDTCSCFTGT